MKSSFGPATLREQQREKNGNPDGLPGFFECVKRQNCQPKTSVFLRQRTQCQSGPHARLDGFCTKQAPVRAKAAAPEDTAAFLCFFSCAEFDGIWRAAMRAKCQSGPHARLDGFCAKQAPVRTKAAAPEGAAAFLCFFSCA